VTNETEQPSDEPGAPTIDALIDERRKKRDALVGLGIDPYPTRFDRTAMADELHERHAGLDPDHDLARLRTTITAVAPGAEHALELK